MTWLRRIVVARVGHECHHADQLEAITAARLEPFKHKLQHYVIHHNKIANEIFVLDFRVTDSTRCGPDAVRDEQAFVRNRSPESRGKSTMLA